MGKINKEKTAFLWSGTAKSLSLILRLQRYTLRMEALKRQVKGMAKETLSETLAKIY